MTGYSHLCRICGKMLDPLLWSMYGPEAIHPGCDPHFVAAIIADRRSIGIAKGNLGATELYKRRFYAAADWLLKQRSEGITSEDIIEEIGLPNGLVGANRNNAVGGIMSGYVRSRGLTRRGYTKSRRRRSNGSDIPLWGKSD